MLRIPKRKETRYTAPDHRPMLPEFRSPEDRVAEAIRENRRRHEAHMPDEYLKWR